MCYKFQGQSYCWECYFFSFSSVNCIFFVSFILEWILRIHPFAFQFPFKYKKYREYVWSIIIYTLHNLVFHCNIFFIRDENFGQDWRRHIDLQESSCLFCSGELLKAHLSGRSETIIYIETHKMNDYLLLIFLLHCSQNLRNNLHCIWIDIQLSVFWRICSIYTMEL